MKNYNLIYEVAKAAAESVDRKEFKENTNYDEKEIKELVKVIIKNDEIILKLKNTIFPGEIKLNEDFYEKIEEFYSLCGFNDNDKILCAKICKLVFEEIGTKKTNQLLDILSESKDRFSWTFLHLSAYLFGIYKLDPDFASKWFWRIAEKVKNDLAGGDIYTGIENYALNFPDMAYKVLLNIKNDALDYTSITIASILLGTIRCNTEFSTKINLIDLDSILKKSVNKEERKIFYNSFSAPFRRIGIDLKLLDNILIDLDNEIPEISSIQYYLLERGAVFQNGDKEFIRLATTWIKDHCTNLTDISQHRISIFLYWIAKKLKELDDNNIVSDLNNILNLIQPIKSINKETWRNVEYYLEDLLDYDTKLFNEAFYNLIDKSYDDLLDIIRNDNQFFLIHRLKTKQYSEFIFPLLISENDKIRNFGFELSQTLGVKIPPKYLNNGVSNKELSILLYGTVLRYIASNKIGDFLLTISPLYQNADTNLKNEFIEEMIFQALNFPSACLEKWKLVDVKSEILQKVLSTTNTYFEKLITTNEIPANSHAYPEIEKGEEQWGRDFAGGVSRSAKEQSVFLKFIRTTNILYGNEWSIYDYNQSMHEPTGFNTTSTSFEWPRLEIIDPEGMAIRRINIRLKLNQFKDE